MTKRRTEWLVPIVAIVIVALVAFLIWRPRPQIAPISAVVQDVLGGRVASITVSSASGQVTYKAVRGVTNPPVRFRLEERTNFYQILLEAGVRPDRMPRIDVKGRSWLSVALWPAIALLAIFAFYRVGVIMSRANQRQTQDVQQMTAAGWSWVKPRYRRQDMAGMHPEVELQLDEVVDMFGDPGKYRKAGAVLPRGVLLSGPPGVGKTMIAHIIAGELGFKELCVVTGPSLMGPFLGMTAMRLHKLFEEARGKQPCVVFFDEFDVAGSARRHQRLSGVDSESHQLVVQLLAELENLTKDDRIVLVAATNRLDMIEPALLRLGRFDRQVEIDLPGAKEREAILRVHGAKPKEFEVEVEFEEIARGSTHERSPSDPPKPVVTTNGYSGADLASLMNEATIVAVHGKAKKISLAHVEAANRRVRAAMTRRSVNENEDGMSRTLARLYSGERHVTFKNVGGQSRAKEELRIVIDYLRDPTRFEEAHCRIPQGILLTGPPGIGKTLLARAVAGEAAAPFFHTSGSEFVQMWVGVAAARIRDLFRIARRQSPCVVFIDELDALAGRRGTRELSGGEEYSHALNQLLSELDGFGERDRVVVIGATNRIDVLDEAILRPGRMDSVVDMSLPDETERGEILRLYLDRNLSEIERQRLAGMTAGRSGADLEMLVNMARIRSVRDDRKGLLAWEDVAHAMAQRRASGPRILHHP